MMPLPLFQEWPEGFRYQEDVLSSQQEQELLAHIGGMTFENFEMHGTIARRRIAFFGETYGRSAGQASPIPGWLNDVRLAVGEWTTIPAESFVMVLINEYRPGAPIGWHRDAPQYGDVAGLSLASACRMRFRPYVSPRSRAATWRRGARRATHEILLVPRSAYLMTGPARTSYEHSIPPVPELRYSVTFRTVRQRADRRESEILDAASIR